MNWHKNYKSLVDDPVNWNDIEYTAGLSHICPMCGITEKYNSFCIFSVFPCSPGCIHNFEQGLNAIRQKRIKELEKITAQKEKELYIQVYRED